jgi:hypothetical protein
LSNAACVEASNCDCRRMGLNLTVNNCLSRERCALQPVNRASGKRPEFTSNAEVRGRVRRCRREKTPVTEKKVLHFQGPGPTGARFQPGSKRVPTGVQTGSKPVPECGRWNFGDPAAGRLDRRSRTLAGAVGLQAGSGSTFASQYEADPKAGGPPAPRRNGLDLFSTSPARSWRHPLHNVLRIACPRAR